MQTKNINNDYQQSTKQHRSGHPASSQVRSPSSVTATQFISATSQHGDTCHSKRPEAPLPSTLIATITCDQSAVTALASRQIPTSEGSSPGQVPLAASGTHSIRQKNFTNLATSPSQEVLSSNTCGQLLGEDEPPGSPCAATLSQWCHPIANMMQPRNNMCIFGSQPSLTTLSSFVNSNHRQAHHHVSQGHQLASCNSSSRQMPPCASNGSKTPPHHSGAQYTSQRHLLSENTDRPLSSINTHSKSYTGFGHSSTLPSNSTLSSLLAAAKLTEQVCMQQQLRRQTSLNHLDKMGSIKPGLNATPDKNQHRTGSFHQRLRAILSPHKESSKTNQSKSPGSPSGTTCTYRSYNGVGQSQLTPDYSVTRLDHISASATSDSLQQQTHELNDISNGVVSLENNISASIDNNELEPERDSYNLRNVCNKLYANKQYACLQTTGESVGCSMQKINSNFHAESARHRNLTSEMNVDKVTTKENIYAAYGRTVDSCQSVPVRTNSRQPTSETNLVTSQSTENSTEHVVVVSHLDNSHLEALPNPGNGLTVRSQQSNSPKTMRLNQGSTLSLNGAEATESVTSQENNYKSSSESGRGTMNSHVEDRTSNHLDLNSPADLTSLDSDQSHPAEVSPKGNYHKYQRNGTLKENDICGEFKSKLSLNHESDSWTSLSDEQSNSKTVGNKNVSSSKHRYQTESKLRTNFSKPENCLNATTRKQLSLSPGIKHKISNSQKVPDGGENSVSGYDKCIYSVPNKGKYRGQYASTACEATLRETFGKDCDGGSLSSETHFPDDACSEYADYQHQEPLRKHLKGIEEMYSELLTMLNTRSEYRPRKKLYRRNSGRSSVASRTPRDHIYRKYRDHPRRAKAEDNCSLTKRYKKLESQVLTLAKSVSQLSSDIQFNYMLNDEIESIRHEISMIKSQVASLKQSLTAVSNKSQEQRVPLTEQHQSGGSKGKESKKVDRFKRLFVDEPQPIKQFLKKLGYDKYLKLFETEKIGLAELIHLDEDRLQKIGIPMGPRIRMLQEAKNLTQALSGRANKGQSHSAAPVESFNIYAVV